MTPILVQFLLLTAAGLYPVDSRLKNGKEVFDANNLTAIQFYEDNHCFWGLPTYRFGP